MAQVASIVSPSKPSSACRLRAVYAPGLACLFLRFSVQAGAHLSPDEPWRDRARRSKHALTATPFAMGRAQALGLGLGLGHVAA